MRQRIRGEADRVYIDSLLTTTDSVIRRWGNGAGGVTLGVAIVPGGPPGYQPSMASYVREAFDAWDLRRLGLRWVEVQTPPLPPSRCTGLIASPLTARDRPTSPGIAAAEFTARLLPSPFTIPRGTSYLRSPFGPSRCMKSGTHWDYPIRPRPGHHAPRSHGSPRLGA